MTRLMLIFVITFLMVMQAPAQERHFHPGAGGGGPHGQSHWDHGRYPRWHYGHEDRSGALLGGIIGGFLDSLFNPPPPPPPEYLK